MRLRDALKALYAPYTFEFAAQKAASRPRIRRVAEEVARCEGKLATHSWRSATGGNLGGWQMARCMFFLNVLTGSIGVAGGTSANVWDKWVPRHPGMAPHVKTLERADVAAEYPLTFYE